MRDDSLIQGAWDYTPKPTEVGAAHMQALIAGALDFDAPRTIDEFAKTTIAELPAAMTRATAMGVIQLKPGAGTSPPGGGAGEAVPTF
jgi:hypothetical protein